MPVRLAVLGLILLAILSTSVQPASTMAPPVVDHNSLWLTGMRPGPVDLSGYVEVPHSTALNPSSGGITVEGWVKRIATDRHETLVGNGWQTSYWVGFYSDGRLRFIPHGMGTTVDSNGTVPAGVWTHVAVSYDGVDTSRFYINGVLDKVSTANPGPLTPAPGGQPLMIGFDVDDTFTPNYFGGGIDNVRIWNVVRSPAQIKAGMFQSIAAPHPGLLAEWSFDGDASDGTGSHDGTLIKNHWFSNEGALPHDIRILQVSVTPSLDGICGTGEYANATQVTVDGTGVWLMHTADDMWVCFEDLGASVEAAQVYLDVDYTRIDPAQPEHLLLEVQDDGTLRAQEGTGSGAYTDTVAAEGLWNASYAVPGGGYTTYRAEYQISGDLLDGWDHVIGLALGKSAGELWPALADADEPSTWSSSRLGGDGEPRTFTGKVVYQPRDSAADPVGIPGVTVRLIGSDPGISEALLAIDETNLNGGFILTSEDDYTEHRLEMGAPPKGYLAEEAEAGAPGVVVDARTVDYGTAISGTYTGTIFTLSDALPYPVDAESGPIFVIVAPQDIIESGALDEFVDFKRRLGFGVEVISIEAIDATFPGATRLLRIRAMEQNRFDTSGGLLNQYLMLIGTDAEIPFARFTFGFTGYTGGDTPVEDIDACLDPASTGVRFWFSEWAYADLASDLDSNGNGCLVDGSNVNPAKTPFSPNYPGPDALPTFQANVAVGRIPFNTESGVRTALTNILRFEQQSESFKRNALMAMTYYWLKGQFWYPQYDENGAYISCADKDDYPDKTGVSKLCKGYTEDAAGFAEKLRDDFMNADGYLSTILYEEFKIAGASPVTSPVPITYQSVRDTLEAGNFGMVNIGGHGGWDGVARAHWVEQNANGLVDSPTQPISNVTKNEIKWAGLIDNNTFNTLTPDNGRGSIYLAAACSTGAPLKDSFGATLLEQGHGVGWIGMLVGASLAAPPDTRATERLLHNNLRLGDALWYALGELCANGSGSGRWVAGLYGDPTLSYWGNPGGQSTLAAWPMLRYDGQGHGYTPLAGPEIPETMWEYSAYSPGTATLPPSPVVSNNGEVIVAHNSWVDVLRQGTRYQRLDLDDDVFGTPAIAADGTIYALDESGNLYAFQYNSYSYKYFPIPSAVSNASAVAGADVSAGASRYRRWKLNLGLTPSTSPIVGSDGFIAVGGSYAIKVVRPDGTILDSVGSVPGAPIGALAVGADRNVYAATTGGHVARINFFDPDDTITELCDTPPSTPPLLAYGYVYVGRVNGEVVKLTPDTLSQVAIFSADSEITAGPVMGPGGQVLVGTANGTLYSLTKNLAPRWVRSIGSAVSGVPAFSADALYIVSGDHLRAYNTYSGMPIWAHDLGSTTGNGSAAVGYGREIYVQTSIGKVVAVGEGWTDVVYALATDSIKQTPSAPAIRVEYWPVVPPIGPMGSVALNATATQSTTVGILLQRSADGGDWEDVAILPPGTTVYTDTDVLPNTSYAYRAQVLDSEGNDSDFTISLVNVQSLPSTPYTPTLISVTTEAADALGLEWTSPVSDVVSGYRVEHSLSISGPFTVALQVGSSYTSAIDTGLDPATDYYYRVIAVNAMSESNPSAVLSGTTRSQSLAAPEHVTATLVISSLVQISWTPGPLGATTVIEYSQGTMAGYEPLATTDNVGPYSYYLPEDDVYIHRVKFVLGDAESEYVESGLVDTTDVYHVYLPFVSRNH